MHLKTCIPLYFSLNAHPIFMKLCVSLNKTAGDERLLLRAKLENLWLWTVQFYPLGIIDLSSVPEIALACSWHENAFDWINALVQCEFLEQTESGFMVVNWDSYGGKLITKRQKDTLRKQRSRSSIQTSEKNTRVEDNSIVELIPQRHGPDESENLVKAIHPENPFNGFRVVRMKTSSGIDSSGLY